MRIQDAVRSMREVCARRHLSINTEKSYTHWLRRFGHFLKDSKVKTVANQEKWCDGAAMKPTCNGP